MGVRSSRARLLAHVRAEWIEGPKAPLRAAVSGWEFVPELEVADMGFFVRTPGSADPSSDDDQRRSLTAVPARLADDVDEVLGGRTILVGDPGCGKSVLLLQIARALLDRADRDEHQPVPVPIDLSGWPATEMSLERYVGLELGRSARWLRGSQVERWINDGSLVLLLDGLDELSYYSQRSCAAAIADYLGEHPGAGLLLACRWSTFVDVFVSETARRFATLAIVHLGSETLLRQRLNTAGDRLAGVRAASEDDSRILEVLSHPHLWGPFCEMFAGASTSDVVAALDGKDVQQIADLVVGAHLEQALCDDLHLDGRHAKYLAWRMEHPSIRVMTSGVDRLTRVDLGTFDMSWFRSMALARCAHRVGAVAAGLLASVTTAVVLLFGVRALNRSGPWEALFVSLVVGSIAGIATFVNERAPTPKEIAGWSPRQLIEAAKLAMAWTIPLLAVVLALAFLESAPRTWVAFGVAVVLLMLAAAVGKSVAEGFEPGRRVWSVAWRPRRQFIRCARNRVLIVLAASAAASPLVLLADAALGWEALRTGRLYLLFVFPLWLAIEASAEFGTNYVVPSVGVRLVLRRQRLTPRGVRRTLDRLAQAGIMYRVASTWRFRSLGLQQQLAGRPLEQRARAGSRIAATLGSGAGGDEPLCDVAILVSPTERGAERTLRTLMERQGWSVTCAPDDARVAVVVWSVWSVHDRSLADRAAEHLANGTLVQVHRQPPGEMAGIPRQGPGVVRPPEPFCFHQAVEENYEVLDGTELSVDQSTDNLPFGAGAKTVLREVASLAGLHRVTDEWNADIRFVEPPGAFTDVVKREHSGVDGRLLRSVVRLRPIENLAMGSVRGPDLHRRLMSSDGESFRTTRGNVWTLEDPENGRVLTRRVVDEDDIELQLDPPPTCRAILRG